MIPFRKFAQKVLNPLQRIPHGVRTIAGICILLRFMQVVVADAPVRTVLMSGDSNYLLVPDLLSFLFAIHGIGLSLGFFWTPVTYMFLHGSWTHLILNMIGLLVFGGAIENVSGKRVLWFVFIVSGIVGGVGWVLSNGLGTSQPCLGASAGVLGLAGAYAALRPRDQFEVFIPFPVILPAWMLAIVLFLLNAMELLFVESHVAYLAHLIGIVAGLVAGLVLRLLARRGKSRL